MPCFLTRLASCSYLQAVRWILGAMPLRTYRHTVEIRHGTKPVAHQRVAPDRQGAAVCLSCSKVTAKLSVKVVVCSGEVCNRAV